MSYAKRLIPLATLTCLAALGSTSAKAQEIKTVFVIAMENHNWTQPANQFTGGIQQIYLNPNAPFINSLVSGTAVADINGSEVNISQQVAFANAYHNVLSTPSGNNPDIHPSEPNYLWAEAGTNFGVLNDNDPFSATGGTNQQWLPTLQSDGSYTFTARNSGNECLDITNRSTANGTQLQQWACTAGDTAQTFRLLPES